jgi:hypothetical protein
MNSLSQQQSIQQSAFKNGLTLLHDASRSSTNLLKVTFIHSSSHPSQRKESSLCSTFFLDEWTYNNRAGIQSFAAHWVPAPLSHRWLLKMLLNSQHESLKSYIEIRSFLLSFPLQWGPWFYYFLHILPLWVYFNHNTRTRLIWNSPMLFKHNASAFILYASYTFQCYK